MRYAYLRNIGIKKKLTEKRNRHDKNDRCALIPNLPTLDKLLKTTYNPLKRNLIAMIRNIIKHGKFCQDLAMLHHLSPYALLIKVKRYLDYAIIPCQKPHPVLNDTAIISCTCRVLALPYYKKFKQNAYLIEVNFSPLFINR